MVRDRNPWSGTFVLLPGSGSPFNDGIDVMIDSCGAVMPDRDRHEIAPPCQVLMFGMIGDKPLAGGQEFPGLRRADRLFRPPCPLAA